MRLFYFNKWPDDGVRDKLFACVAKLVAFHRDIAHGINDARSETMHCLIRGITSVCRGRDIHKVVRDSRRDAASSICID